MIPSLIIPSTRYQLIRACTSDIEPADIFKLAILEYACSQCMVAQNEYLTREVLECIDLCVCSSKETNVFLTRALRLGQAICLKNIIQEYAIISQSSNASWHQIKCRNFLSTIVSLSPLSLFLFLSSFPFYFILLKIKPRNSHIKYWLLTPAVHPNLSHLSPLWYKIPDIHKFIKERLIFSWCIRSFSTLSVGLNMENSMVEGPELSNAARIMVTRKQRKKWRRMECVCACVNVDGYTHQGHISN